MMKRYSDLRDLMVQAGLSSKLKRLSEKTIRNIRNHYEGVPEDYLDYLREIGWGNIGDGCYVVYNMLMEPDFIYGEPIEDDLKEVLFFGDNFSETNSGFFPPDNWAIVEVDPTSKRLRFQNMTFEQYIRSKVLNFIEE